MEAEQILVRIIETPVEIKTSKVDSYLINYIVSGSGKPVLLIHGLNMGWGAWYQNISELAKYFTVYAIDLPGAGGSTKIDFSQLDLQRDFVDVVGKFIKNLGIEAIDIIGHSSGGWVALQVASKFNNLVTRVILVSSLGFTDYVPASQRLASNKLVTSILVKTIMRPTYKSIEMFLKSIANMPLEREFIEYVVESFTRNKLTHPLFLMNRLMKGPNLSTEIIFTDDFLRRVTQPVLIIHGRHDELVPIDMIFERIKLIPNSEIEIFENAGHVLYMEEKEEFEKIVHAFLKK